MGTESDSKLITTAKHQNLIPKDVDNKYISISNSCEKQ